MSSPQYQIPAVSAVNNSGSASTAVVANTTGPCGCANGHDGLEAITDPAQLQQELSTLKVGRWKLSEDRKYLSSFFVCRHFKAAIAYINAAADIAEREDIKHHPDLHLTSYRNIEVKLYTHAVDGLTRFDFNLARELDSISIDYSPKWLKENPLLQV
jgi:4a-hydroxytetrahydrobiopterin dehydratase